MELAATGSGPRYMEPKLSPHETWRRRVDGFANNLLMGQPAVPSHDAAARPNLSARIDLLL
jgi:hypothetical protein